MSSRLTAMVAALVLLLQSAVLAEEPKKAPPKETYATVITPSAGAPALSIRYPWTAHAGASIEVRLVAGEEPEGARIRPMFFADQQLKGEVKIKVYQVRDRAMEVANDVKHTTSTLDLEILGQRNLIGRPAVVVIPKPKAADHSKPADTSLVVGKSRPADKKAAAKPEVAAKAKGAGKAGNAGKAASKQPGAATSIPVAVDADQVPGAMAVFCFLESWSVDKNWLCLDLPRSHFSQAGELYVWFLRGDRIVWEQKLHWPGFDGGAAASSAPQGKVDAGAKKAAAAKKRKAKEEE